MHSNASYVRAERTERNARQARMSVTQKRVNRGWTRATTKRGML